MKREKLTKISGRKYFGFNADALMQSRPEAVAGPDGVYTGAVIGLLLGAVKNLSDKVKMLERHTGGGRGWGGG